MTANVITYRPRLAVRTAGRALGFSEEQLTGIASTCPSWIARRVAKPLAAYFAMPGFSPSERAHAPARRASRTELLNLPRHLGQHSGGMVIAAGRLDEVVPLEPASMPGRVVVQWDKDDCADLGIVKVDLLGLGMMAVLAGRGAADPRARGRRRRLRAPAARRSQGLRHAARRRHGRRVPGRVARADGDAAAHEARAASTTWWSRWRSSAPGRSSGKMVNPYLERRARPASRSRYPHPSLEPILKRTLGVPLFQEQLIRMAMVAAGFTGGQAEELRRAMGFKRSQERMNGIETRSARRHDGERHHGRGAGRDRARASSRSRSTASPSRTPPRSRCSPTRRRTSRRTTRRRSCARCSTTGRWASITRRRWSRTPPATASRFRPIDVTRSRLGCATSRTPGALCGWGCATSAGLREVSRRARRGGARGAPFASLADFAARSGADAAELARAGGDRRVRAASAARAGEALWQVEALGRSGALFARAPSRPPRRAATPGVAAARDDRVRGDGRRLRAAPA